jgi:hypothetical protein
VSFWPRTSKRCARTAARSAEATRRGGRRRARAWPSHFAFGAGTWRSSLGLARAPAGPCLFLRLVAKRRQPPAPRPLQEPLQEPRLNLSQCEKNCYRGRGPPASVSWRASRLNVAAKAQGRWPSRCSCAGGSICKRPAACRSCPRGAQEGNVPRPARRPGGPTAKAKECGQRQTEQRLRHEAWRRRQKAGGGPIRT